MMAEHVAIQQALERRRSLREEEEMTDYRRDDLDQGWEFKILRSNYGAFRNPQTLARVLQEESIAGWTLLEKFDDQRIRLKRPVSSRLNDAQLPAGYDAYRTRFGISAGYLSAGIVMLIMGIGVLVAWLTSGF
jgi:hypothetical protein